MMKHDWELGRFKFACCRVCLIVQNDKNKDADCKGPGRIALKGDVFTDFKGHKAGYASHPETADEN